MADKGVTRGMHEGAKRSGVYVPELGQLTSGSARAQYPLNSETIFDYLRTIARAATIASAKTEGKSKLRSGEFLNAFSFARSGNVYCGLFENSTFVMRPFDPDENVEPNFEYKPTNIKIFWYKHVARSANANRRISRVEMRGIMKDCVKSLDLLPSDIDHAKTYLEEVRRKKQDLLESEKKVDKKPYDADNDAHGEVDGEADDAASDPEGSLESWLDHLDECEDQLNVIKEIITN